MTIPRPWPENARRARDKAAEAANLGARDSEWLLTNFRKVDDTTKLQMLGQFQAEFQTIVRWLESVEAPTQPLEQRIERIQR